MFVLKIIMGAKERFVYFHKINDVKKNGLGRDEKDGRGIPVCQKIIQGFIPDNLHSAMHWEFTGHSGVILLKLTSMVPGMEHITSKRAENH